MRQKVRVLLLATVVLVGLTTVSQSFPATATKGGGGGGSARVKLYKGKNDCGSPATGFTAIAAVTFSMATPRNHRYLTVTIDLKTVPFAVWRWHLYDNPGCTENLISAGTTLVAGTGQRGTARYVETFDVGRFGHPTQFFLDFVDATTGEHSQTPTVSLP